MRDKGIVVVNSTFKISWLVNVLLKLSYISPLPECLVSVMGTLYIYKSSCDIVEE